jgi:hypothetical protein
VPSPFAKLIAAGGVVVTAPPTKTLAERLNEMGGVEVTSPSDGVGFVITGASLFKRPKKTR